MWFTVPLEPPPWKVMVIGMGRKPQSRYLVKVDIQVIVSRLIAAKDKDMAKRRVLKSLGLYKDERAGTEVTVTKLQKGDEYYDQVR